ncbi:MAG TPA: hypothetical protein VGN68_11975 [Sphingopyxis sp.]|uniref:hypothetical protein n=1 Tax=Sphingopyxis sp. TaxID=1908224 RepID=UPI002E1451BD|nr:hypothetical protein [Sphingopyxis sp.]
MTEFLIFLAMCAVFSLLFWRFLKIPNTKQRQKAQAAQEYKELHSRVAAEDAAKQQGFGRKMEAEPVQRFVPAAGQFPLSDYDGVAPDSPFGEDVVSPKSRTIPATFLGTWIDSDGRNAVIFEPNRYQYMDVVGMQPVVAVRHISETEIAVVSQQAEGGKWLYCLQCYGLLDGGSTLTDLENMDMKWVRA